MKPEFLTFAKHAHTPVPKKEFAPFVLAFFVLVRKFGTEPDKLVKQFTHVYTFAEIHAVSSLPLPFTFSCSAACWASLLQLLQLKYTSLYKLAELHIKVDTTINLAEPILRYPSNVSLLSAPGRLLKSKTSHTSHVMSVHLPSQTHLAHFGVDGRIGYALGSHVYVHSTSDASSISPVIKDAHRHSIFHLSSSSDLCLPSPIWMTASKDSTVKCWSMKESHLALQTTYECEDAIYAMATSPNCHHFLIGGQKEQQVRLYTTETGHKTTFMWNGFEQHKRPVSHIQWVPTMPSVCAVASLDQTIRIVDTRIASSSCLVHTLFCPSTSPMTSLCVSPNSEYVSFGTCTGEAITIRLRAPIGQTPIARRMCETRTPLYAMDYLANGTLVIGYKHFVDQFHPQTYDRIHHCRSEKDDVSNIYLSTFGSVDKIAVGCIPCVA